MSRLFFANNIMWNTLFVVVAIIVIPALIFIDLIAALAAMAPGTSSQGYGWTIALINIGLLVPLGVLGYMAQKETTP